MNFNIPIMFLKRQAITLCLIYATICAVHSTVTDIGDITDVIQNRFLAKSQEKVDVVFVIERSQGLYSIPGATDTVFAFVKSLLTRFEIQEDRTRVAVVTYNTKATVDFNFIPDGRAESLNKCKLLSEVDRISRVSASGWTATTDALREARDILFNSREGSQKAIFLITVGKSNIGEPPKVASRELMSLSWNGRKPVDIFALGILDANEEELSSVVSETRYAMYLDTYDSFQQLVVTLADDSEEERWVESVRDNCFSTCSPHAVCMCGLDTGLYHCGCGAGYHGNGAVCEACPLGSYRSSVIPGKCISCPDGNTTSHVGATNASDCVCPQGYINDGSGCTGASCDVEINECLSNPCKNGATCKDDKDSFTCDCPPGYEGETCSDDIDECSGDPCQNSVICHDEIARYRCQCKPSYSGDDCLQRNSLDYDLVFTGDVAEYVETDDLPGLTQFSICVWIKTRDTTNAGTIFTLGTSAQPNTLALYDCRNLKLVIVEETLATTASLNNGAWHHICLTWSSTNGDWRIYKDGVSEKSGTGFQRGRVIKKDATVTIGQYKSSNTDIFIQGRSFIGEMSRLHMYSAVLSAGNVNKLSASSTPLEAKCSLSYANRETLIVAWPDFLQSLSEQQYEAMVRKPSWCGDIDECEDVNTCPENRKCVNVRFGEPQCKCLPAWAGDDCQTVVNCCEPSNPCQNGGTCTKRIGDYTCECPPGYIGSDCEVEANFCLSNPCQNSGTCLLHMYSYSCICAEDYTGQNCEKILTAGCNPSPCLHGGHCIQETPSRISCQCDQDHQGDYCQTMFSPCEFDPSPCLNNGTCSPASSFENKYRCDCSDGYNAVNCAVVNPCHANPCRNHGDVCVRDENSDQGYTA
ncbi:fibropellin-1-like [Ptychodera flava]|uniref:fibropellin-1-like n=1 Tax=Ptychodera flava TaxID=63121 RepID=UPI00396A4FB7